MALSFIHGGLLPHPGLCFSCGSIGVDCIDTGKTQDYYGALLICLLCFRDGALRIHQLNLFDKTLHDDIVFDLEEKLDWRENLEPTIAKLELDLDNAVNSARRGFRQRRITDDTLNEILAGEQHLGTGDGATERQSSEIDGQLVFSIEELEQLNTDERQDNNYVGDQRSVSFSSGPGND